MRPSRRCGRAHSDPFDDLSRGVTQWTARVEEAAILSIRAPQACFDFTALTRKPKGSAEFEQLRQVIRVDHTFPTPTAGVLEADACVFAPALIQEIARFANSLKYFKFRLALRFGKAPANANPIAFT